MLSRFHLIPERYGQTDRQTDRFAISISRVSMLTRDKNWLGHVLRSESLLRTVLEGRMEGTRTRGRQNATMIDWLNSNDVEYEHIKKRPYDREDWHHWRPGFTWKGRARKRERIKCCSVVFGVTLRFLVINTSSSSPAINKLRRLPILVLTTCHGSSQLSVLHLAVEPFTARDGVRYSLIFAYPPAFDAPVRESTSEYCHDVWYEK